jgi:hypothetical protein
MLLSNGTSIVAVTPAFSLQSSCIQTELDPNETHDTDFEEKTHILMGLVDCS